MIVLSQILAIFLSILHIWIMILEMFLWTSPYGLKTFKMSYEKALATKALAANQGLYNGFLAAGILWGLARGDIAVQTFFIICIFFAGIFGAFTASKKILFIQAAPALLTLIVIFFSYV